MSKIQIMIHKIQIMNPQNTNNDPQNTNNDLQNATLKTMDLTTQKTMGINLESEKLGIKRRVEIS